jgi:alpha-beta hydrolase superfamily lysophospholipase
MTFEAFFLPAASGQRFCLFHQPDSLTAARGAVVYVHPFAEEMNKSRRMAALQAKALAAAGYAVLQIDLHG